MIISLIHRYRARRQWRQERAAARRIVRQLGALGFDVGRLQAMSDEELVLHLRDVGARIARVMAQAGVTANETSAALRGLAAGLGYDRDYSPEQEARCYHCGHSTGEHAEGGCWRPGCDCRPDTMRFPAPLPGPWASWP